MSNRLFEHGVIASLVILTGASVGCGKSLSGPSSSAALTVRALTPNTGPTGGVVKVRISGTGFHPGATVTLDNAATDVIVVDGTLITATAPIHEPGMVDVVVTNPGGESVSLLGAYTYVPLTVTALSPAEGLTTGDTVTVTGTGFLLGASVTMDGVAAKVTGVTNTSITASTPVHAAGTVDVMVTNPGSQSAMLSAGYTFKVISLAASPGLVVSGGQLSLTMSWAPLGRGCVGGGDWIALFRVGDPDFTGAANGHSDLWFVHLCGATSGTWTPSAPIQPGEYEFRYMVGDNAVARSNPVTVTASASP